VERVWLALRVGEFALRVGSAAEIGFGAVGGGIVGVAVVAVRRRRLVFGLDLRRRFFVRLESFRSPTDRNGRWNPGTVTGLVVGTVRVRIVVLVVGLVSVLTFSLAVLLVRRGPKKIFRFLIHDLRRAGQIKG
jgi:hypothetical protein